MSDATKVAALRALRYAIAEIEEGLKGAVLNDYNELDTDRWRTPFGTVSVAHPKRKVVFDDADFMAWVGQNYPTEIVTPEPVTPPPKVRDSFRQAMLTRLVAIDDETVVDKYTGMVVEWATTALTKAPYVLVTGPEKDAAIENAVALIAGKLDELTTGLTELTP
jgi:hypothetical protein